MRWLILWTATVAGFFLICASTPPALGQARIGKKEQEALDRVARDPRTQWGWGPSASASAEERKAYDAYMKMPLVKSGELPASALPEGYGKPSDDDVFNEFISSLSNESILGEVREIQAEVRSLLGQLRELENSRQQHAANLKREVSYVESLDALFALAAKYPLYNNDAGACSAFQSKFTALTAAGRDGTNAASRLTDATKAENRLLASQAASSAASAEYFNRSERLLEQRRALSQRSKELLELAQSRSARAQQALDARKPRPPVKRGGEFLGWDAEGNPIVAISDGSGGSVGRDGRGGYTPLIPADGGYLYRDEDGNPEFRPAR